MMDVKQAVEEALSVVRGLPLSSMWRYAGMQKFEFGEQKPFINRKWKTAHQADFGLVVTCDWAIYGREGKIVSSEEFLPHGERHDASAHWFYEKVVDNPPFVQEILAEADGKVTLILSEGFRLDILPCGGEEEEQWRFMPKEGLSHFVVETEGVIVTPFTED